MKVFVTGATGYIGSAVAERLAKLGHEVIALARSDASAARLARVGHRVERGDVADAARVAQVAAGADATIHAANTGTADNPAVDAALVRAILDAYAGSGRPFVYTSGVWSFSDTGERVVDEASPPDPADISAWRIPVEREVLAARGVRGIVLRPGIVHGRGGGIPGMLVGWGREHNRVRFIGDGRQEWSLVHVEDLADLYARALEAPGGTVLHGSAGSPVAMRDLALAASFAAGVPGRVEAWPLAEARAELGGGFADALAMSQRVSAARTRRLTGWTPSGPTVLEEMLTGSYAASSQANAE